MTTFADRLRRAIETGRTPTAIQREICDAVAGHELMRAALDAFLARRVRFALLVELDRLLDVHAVPHGPVRAAASRLYRRKPLADLFELAQAGNDSAAKLPPVTAAEHDRFWAEIERRTRVEQDLHAAVAHQEGAAA